MEFNEEVSIALANKRNPAWLLTPRPFFLACTADVLQQTGVHANMSVFTWQLLVVLLVFNNKVPFIVWLFLVINPSLQVCR